MIPLRTLSSLLLLSAFSVSFAEPVKSIFEIAGSPAGENVFDLKADGSFTSVTKLKLGPNDVESTFSGVLKNGELIQFAFKQKLASNVADISYANGKATVRAGEKTMEKEIKAPKAIFANFHPQIVRTILAQLDKTIPGEQQIETLVIDSGAVIKTGVTPRPNKQVIKNGETIAAQSYLVKVGTTEIEYVFGPNETILGFNVPVQTFSAVAEGYTDVFVDPTTRFKELSQPTFKVRSMPGVRVRLRDGVELATDVFLPEGEGKWPTVLNRTPYNRSTMKGMGEWYAKRGYVFVVQDVRGTGESAGDWNPFMNERKDGYDAIDWIAHQPWSDGKVGMIGASYSGMVQWSAAVEGHPALKCIVPQVSPPDAFFNLPYDHGVPMLLTTLWWTNIVKNKVADLTLAGTPLPHPEKLTTLPITKIDDEVLGVNVPFFDAWWTKKTPKDFAGWDYLPLIPKVKIPALHISGWWDGDGIGTKMNYAAARKGGNNQQWLIYGPWTHAFNTTSKIGDVDYGSDAILELDSLYLRWFDTWLKGKRVNLVDVPKVKVFVTGANRWQELRDWPDPRSKEQAIFLSRSPGQGGELVAKPARTQKPSTYTYDPSKAVIPPQVMGSIMAEASLVSPLPTVESDTLVFKSAPFRDPVTIGGPISLDLYFSTDVKDTDFFAVLLDMDEKGVSRLICNTGKIRAQYLAGWNTPKLLTPGKEYKATLELWDVAHEFRPGHRMVLMVTSSLFPGNARNLNTGESIATATRMVTAHQTIFHDAKRPSAVRFRVLPPR